MIMDKEDKEEEFFTEWTNEEGEQQSTENEDEEKETETVPEKKNGLEISRPSVSLAKRRTSLPCPAQLSTMHLTHLTHLHMATMAPCPVSMRHRLSGGEARKGPRSQDEESEAKRERRTSATPDLLHASEKRRCFRSRNVISLNDADSMCLICHDDLYRRGGTIQELHCSHSFHSECIEEWLWTKQTCPICHKRMTMPEPLYWTSARLKIP